MGKIELPGPIGEWSKGEGRFSRPDGQEEFYFPLDHGFLFAADGGERLDATLAKPGP